MRESIELKKAAPKGHCILHFGKWKFWRLSTGRRGSEYRNMFLKYCRNIIQRAETRALKCWDCQKFLQYPLKNLPYPTIPIHPNKQVTPSPTINTTPNLNKTNPSPTPPPYHTSPSNSPFPAHLDLCHYSNMILMISILVKNFLSVLHFGALVSAY